MVRKALSERQSWVPAYFAPASHLVAVEKQDHEGRHAKESASRQSAHLACFCSQRVARRRARIRCHERRLFVRLHRKAAAGDKHPGRREDEIQSHHDVVHVVIVSRGHIHPAPAGKRAQTADDGEDACVGGGRLGQRDEQGREEDQGEARPRHEGDADLKDVALRVPIAYCRTDTWPVLVWPASDAILDDFVVVQGERSEQGTTKGQKAKERVNVGHKRARQGDQWRRPVRSVRLRVRRRHDGNSARVERVGLCDGQRQRQTDLAAIDEVVSAKASSGCCLP